MCGLELLKTSIAVQELCKLYVQITVTVQSKSSLEKKRKSNEISIEVKRLFISVDLLSSA